MNKGFRLIIGTLICLFMVILTSKVMDFGSSVGGGDDDALEKRSPLYEHPARLKPVPCSRLHKADDQCQFVESNQDCKSFVALFDYLGWAFCSPIGQTAPGLVYTLLTVWLLLLLYLLGTVAEDHFCPALSHLADTLRLAPDVAGVTFLAFGNGSPDVFATVAAVQKGAFSISLGALTGAGAFVTMVVVGSVALVSDARLKGYPVVRDICFYLVALSFITVVCIDGHFTLAESVACLMFYGLYVCVVVGVHVSRTRRQARRRRRRQVNEASASDRRSLLDNDDEEDSDEEGGDDNSHNTGDSFPSATIFAAPHRQPLPAAVAASAISTAVAANVDGREHRTRSRSDLASVAPVDSSRRQPVRASSGMIAAAQALTLSDPQTAVGRIRDRTSGPSRQRSQSAIINVAPVPGIAASAMGLAAFDLNTPMRQAELEQRRRAQILWKRGLRLNPDTRDVSVGESAGGRSDFAAAAIFPHASNSYREIRSAVNQEILARRRHRTGTTDSAAGQDPAANGRILFSRVIEDYGDDINDHGCGHDAAGGSGNDRNESGLFGPGSSSGELNGFASGHSSPHKGRATGDAVEWDPSPSAITGSLCSGKRWARRVSWFLNVVDWGDKSRLSKIVFLATLPFTSLFWLTIPHVEDEAWSRRLAAVTLVASAAIMIVAFSLFGSPVKWSVPLIIGVVAAGLMLWGLRNKRSLAAADPAAIAEQPTVTILSTPPQTDPALEQEAKFREKRPQGWLRFLLACWAFFVSVIWIYLVANELVALLQSFASLLDIREDLLGMTVLAWGNSVGDFVANTVVAKSGFPEMAIGAAFGGPMFNMLMGLGLAVTISNVYHFPNPYPVHLTNASVNALIFLGSSLLLSLLVIGSFSWRIPRVYGIVLICIYLLFSVGAVLTELNLLIFIK